MSDHRSRLNLAYCTRILCTGDLLFLLAHEIRCILTIARTKIVLQSTRCRLFRLEQVGKKVSCVGTRRYCFSRYVLVVGVSVAFLIPLIEVESNIAHLGVQFRVGVRRETENCSCCNFRLNTVWRIIELSWKGVPQISTSTKYNLILTRPSLDTTLTF